MAETAIPVLKDRHKWLLRLIYVRMVAFTIFLAAEATRNPTADVLVLLAVVYALSACWFALLKLNRSYVAQSYVQIALDLLLITWTVNRTGGLDSYFSSLYFLEIVMSSILLERRGAFVAGTASSLFHFAHLDLGYFGYIPTTTNVWPVLPSLQYIISLIIYAFSPVPFFPNSLPVRCRRTAVELEKLTVRLALLKESTHHIVE